MSNSQRNGITSKIERLDAKSAADLLSNKHPNRDISRCKVNEMIDAVVNKRWRVNGETIILDSDGRLIDGQHRCTAVVETGIPIDVFVVRGVDPAHADTIDCGARRTPAHVLAINGYQNSQILAATLRLIDAHARGFSSFVGQKAQRNVVVLGHVAKYPDAEECCTKIKGCPRGITPSALAFCLYLARKKDAAEAELFVYDVIHGTGLEQGDPALVVRDRLLIQNTGHKKLGVWMVSALLVTAWNVRRQGRKVWAGARHVTRAGNAIIRWDNVNNAFPIAI